MHFTEEEIGRLVTTFPEFDNHEKVLPFADKHTGLKGFIAIHRQNKNLPSFGATRFWHYTSPLYALSDALRLSKMMSYKAALAGISYGGAKGVIINPTPNNNLNGSQKKANILKAYADQVNYLGGRFITGTDVGISQTDLTIMAARSPYMVGLRTDPTKFTALGLFGAMKVCFEKVFGKDSVENRSFAIQGTGKIGEAITELLYQDGAKIFVTDLKGKKLKELKRRFPRINIVAPSDIHRQKVDCFCPCALSGALNKKTVPQLKCKIVAGGANNQLENNSIGKLLFVKGILYAPDYLVNAGGLISVVDEYQNKIPNEKRITEKVEIISKNLRTILEIGNHQNRPPVEIANDMAEKVFNGY